MKKTVTLILLTLASMNAFSQTDPEKESFLHFGFAPPLSSNGTKASQYTNTMSLNLLVGISKNEKAFTMGGLTNIILNDANGFQMAGINNLVGNNGSGILLSGLVNNVRNDYTGFQMAGVSNITLGDYSGMQLGGVLNISGSMRGFQFAGLGNISGDVAGFQFAGLFNIARNVRGVQFSTLLNIADNSDYPIGFINIIKNGEKSIGVSYNETGSSVLSFRSGGRVLYGIIGVGYNHKADDEKYVAEAGFGAHINISGKFRINNELKTLYMTSFNSTHVSQHTFSIMPAFKATSSLEIFAGPSINYMESDNVMNGKLFPNHSMWKKYTAKNMKQLYVGYTVGTHFIF